MSPLNEELSLRGATLTGTPATFTDVLPTEWASEETTASITSATAIGAITTFETSYSTPVATTGQYNQLADSPTSHLGLAVGLPIALGLICAFIVTFLLYRHKARRNQNQQRASWSKRLTWVSDAKRQEAFDDETAPGGQGFHSSTPLSPISPVLATYPREERKESL